MDNMIGNFILGMLFIFGVALVPFWVTPHTDYQKHYYKWRNVLFIAAYYFLMVALYIFRGFSFNHFPPLGSLYMHILFPMAAFRIGLFCYHKAFENCREHNLYKEAWWRETHEDKYCWMKAQDRKLKQEAARLAKYEKRAGNEPAAAKKTPEPAKVPIPAGPTALAVPETHKILKYIAEDDRFTYSMQAVDMYLTADDLKRCPKLVDILNTYNIDKGELKLLETMRLYYYQFVGDPFFGHNDLVEKIFREHIDSFVNHGQRCCKLRILHRAISETVMNTPQVEQTIDQKDYKEYRNFAIRDRLIWVFFLASIKHPALSDTKQNDFFFQQEYEKLTPEYI